jgi:hypothetical protein
MKIGWLAWLHGRAIYTRVRTTAAARARDKNRRDEGAAER